MKTIILSIFLIFIGSEIILSQTISHQNPNTIVLVHGAWMDASVWDKVVPVLRSKGHEVIAVNLPGHGKDQTAPEKIQLDDYVIALKKAIGSRKNVTLVGHSMGGIVISQAAEQIPDQIHQLIYAGAYLPKNGEAIIQLADLDKGSLIGKYLNIDNQHGSGSISKDGIKEVFAADAPENDVSKLIKNHKADPLSPLATPVSLTDSRFGKIPKTYIYTINDQAVTYSLQQIMVKNYGLTKTYSLPSSHSPFFSMPGVLAAIILQESL